MSGHALCEGNPVIDVQSTFFFHGYFTDYERRLMSLNILLISKDWLEWADESKSLTAGARLIFRPRSEVTYKEKVSHHSVAVAGDV